MKLYKVLTCKRVNFSNGKPDGIPGEDFNDSLRKLLIEDWKLEGEIRFSRSHEVISCILSKEI